MVKYLISIESNENKKKSKGQTSILFACYNGKLDTVKYLISLGCDPNEKDSDGQNGLLCGCFNGNLEIVKYLIFSKCDPNEEDFNGANQKGDRGLNWCPRGSAFAPWTRIRARGPFFC